MSADETVVFRGARIRHGAEGDRVYLMHVPDVLQPGFFERLDRFATERGYGKIFAKVREHLLDAFVKHGYRQEARVPDMYRGTEAGCFMARYHDPERRNEPQRAACERVLDCCQLDAGMHAPRQAADAGIRKCTPDDVTVMGRIYGKVFESYPFPIHDPAYLLATMRDGSVRYFCAETGGKIRALAAAEIDRGGANAEMTDFATLPGARGCGLAGTLLGVMETSVREDGIRTSYTIARAVSKGINMVFARGGYQYAGRLINNTPICGQLESMNVWYRRL